MRLEERIVLDGAAAVVVEHAIEAMADPGAVDIPNDAKPAKDSHATPEAHNFDDPGKNPVGESSTPDVGNLLKAIAPQNNQSVDATNVTKDNNSTSSKEPSQPEEDPITVLVASSGLADVDDLVGAAKENVITVTYDADTDNPDEIFNKIESALDGKQAASIGFASHSIGSGSIHLADGYAVDADTLLSNPEMSTFWKNVGSLVESDGHIDLLGCGVGEGAEGKDFIAKLEQLTGREIAASIDDTGNAEAGGNWLLEEGGVDLAELYFDSAKLNNFDGVLATPSITIELTSGGTSQTLYDADVDGYYEIDSAEKLIALSQTSAKGSHWFGRSYELTKDIIFDVDETSVDWDGDGSIGDTDDIKGFNPIGEKADITDHSGNCFMGNFMGNGHTVYNLFINRPTEDNVGLFGGVTWSSIKDVNVRDASIRGNSKVGALIGASAAFTVLNCSSSGEVRATENVGGLVGVIGSGTQITNCTSSALVTGKSAGGLVGSLSFSTISKSSASGTVFGGEKVGGLLGVTAGSEQNVIKQSFASGNVKAIGDQAGGLVGNFAGTITDSYATGNVDGSTAVGGLVGITSGWGINSIENSYATGEVTGTANIGGLIGRFGDTDMCTNNLKNSFATGKVTGSSTVGGLLGVSFIRSSVTNCYSSGSVVGIDSVGGFIGSLIGGKIFNSYTDSIVSASGDQVGGFVGEVIGYVTPASIINSYATGAVTAKNKAGGFAGLIRESSSIKNSYATGFVKANNFVGGFAGRMQSSSAVDSCYASGEVVAKESVGGLVGELVVLSGFTPTVSNSYASGNVSGDSSVGGVVGSSKAKLNNCSARNSKVIGRSFVGRVVGNNSGTLISNNAKETMILKDQSQITIVAGKEVVGEMILDRGPSGEDGQDSSGTTYGAYSFWDESVWAFPSDKSKNPTIKLAGKDSSYDIYKNWDNTFWNIPADTTKNPTLKNVGVQAIVPDPDPIDPTPSVNHAPTLSGHVTMTSIMENTSNPTGQTVSSLIGSVASDADDHDLGIAITNVNDTGGEWQYFSSGSWRSLDTAIGSSAAFLLSGSDKIRFKPNSGWKGNAYLRFRAWDGTDGALHSTVSSIGTGASSAFSSGQKLMKIKVNAAPVVDKPVPELNVSKQFNESDNKTTLDYVIDTSNKYTENVSSADKKGTVIEYAESLKNKYESEQIDHNQLIEGYIKGLIYYNDDSAGGASETNALVNNSKNAAWIKLRGGDPGKVEASEAAKIVNNELKNNETKQTIATLETLYSNYGTSFNSDIFYDKVISGEINVNDNTWNLITKISKKEFSIQKFFKLLSKNDLEGRKFHVLSEHYLTSANIKDIVSSYQKTNILKELSRSYVKGERTSAQVKEALQQDQVVDGNFPTGSRVAFSTGEQTLYLEKTGELSTSKLKEIYGRDATYSVTAVATYTEKSGGDVAYDGPKGVQCVALVKAVIKSVSGIDTGELTNGKSSYYNVGKASYNFFDIGQKADTSSKPPKNGAVISFAETGSNPYGHVAIVKHVSDKLDDGSYNVTLFEQNVSSHREIKLIPIKDKDSGEITGFKSEELADGKTSYNKGLVVEGWANVSQKWLDEH
ncbi:GLUG motif-containing protein [Maridesulfovibrio ferrireducens]|uniref:GLUG motif-containing protein n=1 Tax=Maridesulfovibrio ferrireducens TaxID=246191 RepID=UPI001A1A53D2|nr:GLUG motif-containing protein [Maridesulfovibrio ferrireducens]MBI9112374.1 DUF4347 domain-containing protein [Maridesulfovibrio ferrireducens]